MDRGGICPWRDWRGRSGDERRCGSDSGRSPISRAPPATTRAWSFRRHTIRSGQRHQGLLRQRREVHRTSRAAGGGDRRRSVVACARRNGRETSPAQISSTVSRSSVRRLARCVGARRHHDRHRLRKWRDDERRAGAVSDVSASRRSSSATSRMDETSISNCGSTHPDQLVEAVKQSGAQIGVAFDGDGDRAIFVDHRGRIVNGDAVLLMCGRQLKNEGRLTARHDRRDRDEQHRARNRLAELGITLVRTAVGDKYVMEEMQSRGASLGGEQSGHIIFSDYLFTGDGLCTALNVLQNRRPERPFTRRSGRRSGHLSAGAAERSRARARRSAERAGGRGQRFSASKRASPITAACSFGIQAPNRLLRVMLEGRDEHEIRAWRRRSWTSSRSTCLKTSPRRTRGHRSQLDLK